MENAIPRCGPLPTDAESVLPLWASAPWLAPSVQEEEEGGLQVWHPGSCCQPSKASSWDNNPNVWTLISGAMAKPRWFTFNFPSVMRHWSPWVLKYLLRRVELEEPWPGEVSEWPMGETVRKRSSLSKSEKPRKKMRVAQGHSGGGKPHWASGQRGGCQPERGSQVLELTPNGISLEGGLPDHSA